MFETLSLGALKDAGTAPTLRTRSPVSV